MKYRILNYDLCEYKLLENELNQLSQEGINPTSIDYISTFKKDNKHYYYYTDILIKKTGITKRELYNEIIDRYIFQDFDYCGKVGKILVFRKQNKTNPPITNPEDVINHLKIRVIKKISLFLFAAIFFGFLSKLILSNNQIDRFVTNGNIILHYVIIPIALTILYRIGLNIYINKKMSKKPAEDLILNKKESQLVKLLKNIFKGAAIICLILLLSGMSLDYIERKEINVDKTILTLADFNLESNKKDYPTYTQMSSFLVDTTSYAEVNDQEDAIYCKQYVFHNQNQANKYFKRFLDNVSQDSKTLKIDDSTYLVQSSKQYDTLIYQFDHKFVYVTTTFELYDSLVYQDIIQFYHQ